MAIMHIYDHILSACQQGKKQLAVLIDPEKWSSVRYRDLDEADLIFLGGSTGALNDDLIEQIRKETKRPIVLFPGNIHQFSAKADAILFLSVLSSMDSQLLIGQQIRSARVVQQSGIESIPMGYIVIDGGTESSVCRATNTSPMDRDDIHQIVDVAIAAELLGKKLVYLEAGSGANIPVSIEIIRAVRAQLSIPLIVGGGIVTKEQMKEAFLAGADMVVVGNHFEQYPEHLKLFCYERG